MPFPVYGDERAVMWQRGALGGGCKRMFDALGAWAHEPAEYGFAV